MKNLIALLALTLLPSCLATSGELQALTNSVARLEVAAEDPQSTQQDLEEALLDLKETAKATLQAAEQRGSDFVVGLEELLTGGGLLGALFGTGLLTKRAVNAERNQARLVRGEPVAAAPKS